MQIYLQFSRMQLTFTERSDVKLVQMSEKSKIYLVFFRMQPNFTVRSDVKLVQMSEKGKIILYYLRFSSKTIHFIGTKKSSTTIELHCLI